MKTIELISIFIFLFFSYTKLYSQTGWLQQNSPVNINLASVSFVDVNTGYIVGKKELLKTTNGGTNWFVKDSALQIGYNCNKLQFLNQNTGFLCDGDQYRSVYRTTNSGDNWTGIGVTGSGFCFMDSIHGWFCSPQSGNSICVNYTSDGGNTWNPSYFTLCSNTGRGAPVGIDFGSLSFGITVGYFWDVMHNWMLSYISRSTNGGSSWTPIHINYFQGDSCAALMTFGPNPPFTKVYSIDSTTGLIFSPGNQSGIIRTYNAGLNWEFVGGLNTPVSNFWFVNHNIGYGVATGRIVYTTDCTSTWSNQYTGVTSQIGDICMLNGLTGWAVGDSGLILKTTTGGIITVPPPPRLTYPHNDDTGISLSPVLGWLEIDTSFNYKVLIASDSLFLQVIDSSNIDTNHYQIPSGKLQNLIVYYWKVRASSLLHGPGPYSVIFHFETVNLTVVLNQNGPELPKEYCLYTNYPNPFNPTTKIKFDIPAYSGLMNKTHTKLVIYDAIGREVSTLVNEQLKAGSYEVEWNAANYPSGVYFYRLVSGEFNQTKKLVLIK